MHLRLGEHWRRGAERLQESEDQVVSYRIVSLVMLENISIKSLKYDFLNMSSRSTIEIDMAKRTRESSWVLIPTQGLAGDEEILRVGEKSSPGKSTPIVSPASNGQSLKYT